MFVPSLLLKQLYTFGSLKNSADGLQFSMKNRLSDATLTGLRGILSHRLRSILTTLGILFGVAAVICTVGIGKASSDSVNARIAAALLADNPNPGVDWHSQDQATIVALYHERLRQFLATTKPAKSRAE